MKNPNTVLTTILIVSGSLAVMFIAQGVTPAPDGGYAGGNTAEGQSALFRLTTGTYNTAIGLFSLETNTIGNFNTALGAGALLLNTGDQNTGTGTGALLNSTTGGYNTANGTFALFNNIDGAANTATGASALFSNTSGEENTADGGNALLHNVDGIGNTAAGFDALYNNVHGSGNTGIGRSALSNTIADGNTAVGFGSLTSNNSGASNTAIGINALGANTTGANNTAIGAGALGNNTAGNNNIALGAGAGSSVVTASDTICIGIVGVDVTDGCYIGHVFEEPLDPDNLPMAIEVHGKVGTLPSSRRFKDNIKPMDKTSEAILALKPVTFHYKNDTKRSPRFGLIAEQVAEVDPNLVARDKEGKPYSVRYEQVNAMLLNEFLKEHHKVENQERQIHEQQTTIIELMSTVAQDEKNFQAVFAEQEKHIKTLASNLRRVSSQAKMREAPTKVVVANP
jgi:hypothetical protein